MDKEGLVKVIRKVTEDHWKAKGAPLLLSQLPGRLTDVDYEDVLQPYGGLKAFLDATAGVESGYRLSQHPLQTAKIGVMPFAEKFEYSDVTETMTPTVEISLDLLKDILRKLDKAYLPTLVRKLPPEVVTAVFQDYLSYPSS